MLGHWTRTSLRHLGALTPTTTIPTGSLAAASIAARPLVRGLATTHAQRSSTSEKPGDKKPAMPSLMAEAVRAMPTSEASITYLDDQSYHGMSQKPFPDAVADVLMAPLDPADVEIKPDGLIYLPEIKYRRILNRAFKPGGWALAPRGPHSISGRTISREYALFALGQYVSQARGEMEVFDEKNMPTAMEGCRSNALMRCCKDLGIASELWDPVFIRDFKAKHCEAVWAKHVGRGTKTKLWRKKGNKLEYPSEAL
ncbi:hypothetical protein AMAG_09805 [Allomyces macrogynus ATCC 38327]|uniref:Mitochondrial genome maintenance protein MGM101 n=1 Tax=Allomyces macrogynus (strain ATCC 38327) TaxID=578462 RepID=A0A0L0SU19_ALLM3|nr:hypothetical protein AMAG_09805 [Allomyces macrogynus ATCC 38327]|eukprot:KNE65834.1 hypothetical protein AMAG_09805 [Allomyces macrogynus ATCC 38327]